MCIFPLEDISVMAEYDTPCCVPLLNNNNLASIHGRVPLWELWDLAPYAEGLGRSLTLLDNGHTDLSPGCAPYSGLWTGFSPPWPGSPWKTLSEAITHRWESFCGFKCAVELLQHTAVGERIGHIGRLVKTGGADCYFKSSSAKLQGTWAMSGSSVGWSLILMCQGCGFDPRLGRMKESSNKCMSGWNDRSVSLSPSPVPPSLPLWLKKKSICKFL